MIMIYKVKYICATNTSGAKFQVTRMDDHRVCRTPYKHGVISPVTHAVHDTFGEDPDKLAFVGFTKKGNRDEALWAIQHN